MSARLDDGGHRFPLRIETKRIAPGEMNTFRVPHDHGVDLRVRLLGRRAPEVAALVDELAHGRDGMRQPFHFATPEEAALSHELFTEAIESHASESVVKIPA